MDIFVYNGHIMGIFQKIQKIVGDPHSRLLSKLGPAVAEINALEQQYLALGDEALKAKTAEFKSKIEKGEALDDILPGAFAAVREAARRTLGQRHYDVQLMGGMILHQGKIAEMRTGEGKTLVATLAAYLNALVGKGVHVVTVNDYLSRRDTVWMGQVYDALGLSVGCITHDSSYIYDREHKHSLESDKERDTLGAFKVVHEYLRPCLRREAYEADITYGTNNEFGFDFLRDSLAQSVEQVSQRGYNFAVVDEVDSILIDEARTPLIISAPAEESSDFYITFSKIAAQLKQEDDYKVDEKVKAVSLTEEGIERAEKLLGVKDIYTEKGIKYVHHLESAVKAKALFHLDKDYVVKNGEIIIVDEFTGRLMPGRRWSEGLHQAVEAKEGVTIQKESRTMASITFQNYFRMYSKLSGMTGTAQTSAEEFHKVYKIETVSVPTNKPLSRKDGGDQIFQTEDGKFKAVARKIKELHEKGQPVLVGTVSIDKNERLAKYLDKEGVPYKLLNAKNHEEEGAVIAQAGRKGGVTIATNMAGRGVDIILGGNPPDKKEAEEVRSLGGLFVIGTERHEARRIDNQLRGRAGRQGDPGESQFYVSMEDDLLRIFGSDRIRGLMDKLGIPEDMPIENSMITRSIESAQTKIEGMNFDSRKHLLEYDDVMSYQRNIIYERRRKILFGDSEYVKESLYKVCEEQGVSAKDLEAKREELGDGTFVAVERGLMLQAIDVFWVDHLEAMDYMRSSVRLRAYGQRDPLVEYKNDGLRMFRQLEGNINHTIAEMALKVGTQMPPQPKENVIKFGNEPVKKEIGRNDPCSCGSGKKYKKCCGK